MSVGAMTGMDQCAPSQEASLEVAHTIAMGTQDTIQSCHQVLQSIEDYIDGPHPEVAGEGRPVDSPAGMVARLCYFGQENHEQLMHLQKRLVQISHRLGAQA